MRSPRLVLARPPKKQLPLADISSLPQRIYRRRDPGRYLFPKISLDARPKRVYLSNMINGVTIDRQTGDGKYADVLDVAEHLGRGDQGSAANALAVMVRQSPMFLATLRELKRAGSKKKDGKAVA